MRVDIEILAVVVSALFAVYIGIKTFSRNASESAKKDACESAKISVKLDEIGNDVKDIKYEISSVKTEVKDIDKRLTVAEQNISSASKRIEDMARE